MAARQTPDGLDSSRTNMASDQGVGKARRSIEMTCGRSEKPRGRIVMGGVLMAWAAWSVRAVGDLGVGSAEIVRAGLVGNAPFQAVSEATVIGRRDLVERGIVL